jgi:hypothetical protein
VSNGQSKPSAAPGLRGLKNARYAQFAVILVAVLALWAGVRVLLSSDKKPKVQSANTDPGKVAVKAITAPGKSSPTPSAGCTRPATTSPP